MEFFYGKTMPQSVRAWVVELDGRVLGIGGISYDGWQIIVFSQYDPELDKYPVTKVRGVKKILEIMGDLPAIAVPAKEHPNAPGLLERLGFSKRGDGTYQWLGKLAERK